MNSGSGGRASAVATGLQEVADAFVRGQVETLLLDPGQAAHLTLTLTDQLLGSAPEDLDLRADLALLAAATGADVRVAPSTLGGNPVAALLRWDQSLEGNT